MRCPNKCIGDGAFDPYCEYCDGGKPIPVNASAGYSFDDIAAMVGGNFPLVLYFANAKDRDEFLQLYQEVKPDVITRKL